MRVDLGRFTNEKYFHEYGIEILKCFYVFSLHIIVAIKSLFHVRGERKKILWNNQNIHFKCLQKFAFLFSLPENVNLLLEFALIEHSSQL